MSKSTVGFRGNLSRGRVPIILLGLACACCMGIESARAADPLSFSDGFEGPTLNPFWSKLENAGSITFPSSAKVHSGLQSVQFNSVQGQGQKNIELLHNFENPQYGTVSVWVFDTGADLTSSNYLAFFVTNSAQGKSTQILTQDYDLGPTNGGNYDYVPFNGSGGMSTVDRTQNWHQWSITATASTSILAVDGHTIFSGPGGIPFDRVVFTMSGPDFRPSFTSHFDDFSFQAVPEPALGCLALIAVGTLAVERRRRAAR